MKYLSLIASALAMLGQTLNIGLKEGTYSVYAVGGASSSDNSSPIHIAHRHLRF